jgi:hypothetical protein
MAEGRKEKMIVGDTFSATQRILIGVDCEDWMSVEQSGDNMTGARLISVNWIITVRINGHFGLSTSNMESKWSIWNETNLAA